MNVSSDPSQFEARAKVLKFPASPGKNGSGVAKYWLIGSLVTLVILAGGAFTWWTIGAKNTVQYLTTPVTRGPITRAVTATGTVNPELTIIVGTYVSGVIQKSLLRLQHRGKSGPDMCEDRSAAISSNARSIYRPASSRSGHTRKGPGQPHALSATLGAEFDCASAGRRSGLCRSAG